MTFDKHGYPTNATLKKIAKWKMVQDDPTITVSCPPAKSLVYFIEECWHWETYCTFDEEKGTLELHTGGWSGNEDIVGALQKNFIFWSMYWQRSERGGHYYFAGIK